MSKRIFVVIFAILIPIFSACSPAVGPSVLSDSAARIQNPVRSSDAEEIRKKLGIRFDIPKNAGTVAYTIIDLDGPEDIAQAAFSLNGASCCYRIVSAASFSDISGLFYDWTVKKDCEVNGCAGEMAYNESAQGWIGWYDVAQGLLYCVSVDTGAGEAVLMEIAESVFIS